MRTSALLLALLVVVLLPAAGFLWWRVSGANAPKLPENGKIETKTELAPLTTPLVEPKIVIRKSARVLLLYAGGAIVRTYRVGLGGSPVGDKEREGDGRTPEGQFYITNRNPKSRYTLSLGLSYPNREDAERGLRDRLITREQHDDIVRAIEAGKRPPWDTALGGEIFIHGRGSGSDWTLGCVALDDDDIRELYEVVPVGTPVTIEP
jgi:murein L,D-transpeptidase YafK